MPVRLNGSTSGYVELAAPAVADNSTVNVGELTASGLVPVAPSSVAIATGSGSLSGYTTTFTGATSVSLNGCFTGNHSNYRIVFDAKTASSFADVKLRFRASGTDNSSSNYARRYLLGTASSVQTGTSTNTEFSAATVNTLSGVGDYFIADPFPAVPTIVLLQAGGTTSITTVAGYHNQSVSYDGFTLFVSSGTITGTVSVYGYHL